MRKSVTNRFRQAGFSLIELLVAVAIMGALVAVAYPSYQRYVAQARRTDATTNLMRIAALQEKFLATCGGQYAPNFGTPRVCAIGGVLDAGLNAGNTTRDGFYLIAVAPGNTGNIATSFLLTATPVGTQAVNDNAFCSRFTIDNTGVKGALGTDSLLLGPNGGKCWKK